MENPDIFRPKYFLRVLSEHFDEVYYAHPINVSIRKLKKTALRTVNMHGPYMRTGNTSHYAFPCWPEEFLKHPAAYRTGSRLAKAYFRRFAETHDIDVVLFLRTIYLDAVEEIRRMNPDVKVVYDRHDAEELFFPQVTDEIMNANKRINTLADVIVVVTEPNIEICGFDKEKTLTIINGVDYSELRAHVEAAHKKSLPYKRPIIAYMGAITSNYIDIKILKKIAESRPEWSIIMIGDGEIGYFKKELPSNVYFLGHKPFDEMLCYLKGADVFIMPMVREHLDIAWPTKTLIYLALGKFQVSSHIYEVKKRLSDTNVIFAETGEEFISGIEQALSDNPDTDIWPVVKQFDWAEIMTPLIKRIQS